MPPSTRRTTKLRVFLALLLAFALPSLVLGQAFYWTSPTSDPKTLETVVIYTPMFLLVGLTSGWPYVLGAAACWAMLDHIERHHAWTAALVGVLTGLAVAMVTFPKGNVWLHQIAHPLCAALGSVTGLAVWLVAYGRQDRLPAPNPTSKPRLAL